MDRRDRFVVAVLALALVGLGLALALPRAAPQEVVAAPTPAISIPPPVVYREGVVGGAVSVNPLTARTRTDRALCGLVFSGLVRLGADNRLEPDLATSWSSDATGRTWTFRLRDGARWHDGVPVTADDVTFTVGLLRDPAVSGAMASSWAGITATAVDERTVTFSLETPIGGFLAAATQPLLPAHILAEVPPADLATDPFGQAPVGTGPFAITELDASHATLEPAALVMPQGEERTPPASDSLGTPGPTATPARTLPYLDRIELRFYHDAAALEAAFRSGEVDGAAGLPGADAADLAGLPGARLLRYPTTTLGAALLDLRPSHRELRDANVRRALLAAIDRDALVDEVLGGGGVRADALVPPGSWAFDAKAAAPVGFERKQVASLLKAAGWTKVGGRWAAPRAKSAYALEVLTVPASANPRLAAVAAYVARAWKAVGFDATVVELPAAELVTRLREGRFTAAIVDVAMGLEPDLYPLLASAQTTTKGGNLSGYQDPALDPLLEAARLPGTDEERRARWRALLAALAERQPILPLAWTDEVVVVRGLEGPTPRLIADPGDRFWDVLAWRLAADR